ncbi:hypothetical protein [uncultured Jannaschia sp.]|uniref:hypothetical protein n=1 Tax=uncultured Jannaschia sp. TaxID=293347 RepID=UPI00262B43E5|nr:hypothetical protein [uncultured Jannaschia sp.]
MGEYAEIEMWGTTTTDLSPEEWSDAYDDIDADQRARERERTRCRCPICGAKKKCPGGAYRHAVAVHKKAQHAATIEAFRAEHDLPSLVPRAAQNQSEA